MERPRSDTSPTPAPLWRRALALLLDWLAMWSVVFAMQVTGVSFWIRRHSESVTPSPWDTWFLASVTVAALFAALAVTYTRMHGQTPGMDLLRIRVEPAAGRTEGDRVPLAMAASRWALPALAIALPPLYAAAALAVLAIPSVVDRDRRTLADRLARTRVVVAETATAAPRSPVNTNVIRFGMEKWIGGVTGNHREVPRHEALTPDPTSRAD